MRSLAQKRIYNKKRSRMERLLFEKVGQIYGNIYLILETVTTKGLNLKKPLGAT
jgi:hypothetical protein